MDQENETQRQIQNLESGDLREKLRAIRVLRQHRTEPNVIEAFVKALDDSEQIVQCLVAWYVLGTPDVASRDVIYALARCLLEDPKPDVRAAAADALGHIGPDAKKVVPMLIMALEQDGNISVLHNVIVALGCIGPGARAAVPVLREARKDKHIAEQCERALYRIKHGSG